MIDKGNYLGDGIWIGLLYGFGGMILVWHHDNPERWIRLVAISFTILFFTLAYVYHKKMLARADGRGSANK